MSARRYPFGVGLEFPPRILPQQLGVEANLVGTREVHAFLPSHERPLQPMWGQFGAVGFEYSIGAIRMTRRAIDHGVPKSHTLQVVRVGPSELFIPNLADDNRFRMLGVGVVLVQSLKLRRKCDPALMTALK